jgi:hypothetical protein
MTTKTEKLTLISGSFSNQEAKEILTSIFSSKIKFHELKNFSSQERFGKDDETAAKRLPLLREEQAKLLHILKQAEQGNRSIQINSEILITTDAD